MTRFLSVLTLCFLIFVGMFSTNYIATNSLEESNVLRLDVPTFVQHFEPWKEQQYGFGNRTIEYAGCALTSLAMLLKFNNVDTDPKQLNNYLRENAGYEGRENIRWSVVDRMSGGKLRFSRTVNFSGGADLNLIKRQIDAGNPVIARVDYQNTNHFVVICGYKNDTFYINDPWTENSSKTINEGFEPYGDPRNSIRSIVLFDSNSASKRFVPVVEVAVSKFDEPIMNNFLPVVSFPKIELTMESPFIKVGDEVRNIDDSRKVTPLIVDGRTYLPIRAITEAIGGEIYWEEKSRKIEIMVADRTVEMWIDKRQAFINGHPFPLDSEPISISGRGMLPIRPLIERLGGKILWDGESRTITILSNFREADEDDLIKTDDQNLEKALRHIFRMPTGNILYSDFESKKIKEIWIGNRGIKDITALEKATYLEGLYLNNNEISDITALSNLTSLKVLDLSGNNITDITALRSLDNLVEINLNDNQIKDYEILKSLKNLEVIRINRKRLTKFDL